MKRLELFALYTLVALSMVTPALSQALKPAVTVNTIYRFLHDGITQSGYSHGALVYDEVI